MSYLVPLVETFYKPTNPVTFMRGKSVYVYFRGTTEEVPLYASSSGSSAVSQPLTTDSSGQPRGSGNVVPWSPPVAVDFKVNGETVSRDLAGAAQQFLDAREWIGYTPTTSDRRTKLQKALDSARDTGPGAMLVLPPWEVAVSGPVEQDSFVELAGHLGASRIKVGAGSNSGALKAARYNAGGETGGTERISLKDIDFDGNFAQNGGSTELVVALDGIRPIVERIHVKNGYKNFNSRMSRNLSPGTSKAEDGIFRDISGFDSQVQNVVIEGPHDSQIYNVLARTNEGVNAVSNGTALVWHDLHAYGNATYSLEGGGIFHGLIAEGGKSGQVKILGDSSKFFNPWLFDGGGADGKIGFVFGDSEHSANTTLIVGARIDNCINGALVFNRSAANSYISGLISAASGNIATEVSNASPKLNIDALRVTGGCVNNLATRTKSSQAEVEPPYCPEVELTGTSEVTTLKPSYAGHVLTLRLTSTAKVKDNGGTLNLAGDFTGPGMLTLRCDGTSFREMSRAAI